MVSPASRVLRGRWSGAGRTLRGSDGAHGLLPGWSLAGRTERALPGATPALHAASPSFQDRAAQRPPKPASFPGLCP